MGKLRHNEETHLTGRVGEDASGPGGLWTLTDRRGLVKGDVYINS